MLNFSSYILPIIVALVIIYGLFKKIEVFSCFINGAKKGLNIFKTLMPSLTALIVAVTMLDISGGLDFIKWLIKPFASALGIPDEVIPLAVISPLSGSGSLSVFENILAKYGADSFIGRVASVMMGSTETTFYAIAVYYGAIGIKKTRHTVIAGLFADFIGFILSNIMVRLFFC
ncbi:MAG: spore maturation protein [Clostridiales bacterium]|nr:spore maturation protein [Clostridiales bacterium]